MLSINILLKNTKTTQKTIGDVYLVGCNRDKIEVYFNVENTYYKIETNDSEFASTDHQIISKVYRKNITKNCYEIVPDYTAELFG